MEHVLLWQECIVDKCVVVCVYPGSICDWLDFLFQVPHTLQSVVLFDSLNSDFDITYILMRNNESWEKVPIHASAEQGVASLLNYKMLASDQLQVKVSVCRVTPPED